MPAIALSNRAAPDSTLMDSPMPDPDAPLVARLVAGDESAVAALMQRHGPRLRQLAARMSGRSDEAEDIVQEAFFAVWRRARYLRLGEAPFGAYVTRAVINRCIDRARYRKLRRLVGLEGAPEIEDDAPAADEQLSARSELAAVRRDLSALPERQRAAILLVSTGERSVTEVAGIMGLSVGAAEQLLVRARRTLRGKALERMGQTDGGPASEKVMGR